MGVELGDSATMKPSRASFFGEEDEQVVIHQIQRQGRGGAYNSFHRNNLPR